MRRRAFLQAAGVGSTALALPAAALAADGSHHLGGAPRGHTAFEFLGRSNQDGPTVTHFGYLTHIFGLPDDELFDDGNVHTEATARFTFRAQTTLDARHEHGNIITTSAPGKLVIYLNANPGADFDDPSSFANGVAIASFEVRYHNVLNVQAPNEGVTAATVDLTQRKMKAVPVAGARLQFGRTGLRARLAANGQGTRTQVDPVRAVFLVGGSAIVTGP